MNASNGFSPRNGLLRGILRASVARLVWGLTVALLWDRFVSHGGTVVMVETAFFVIGAVLAVMAWFSYLRLDGVSWPVLRLTLPKKSFKKHTGDLSDYTDEPCGPSYSDDKDRIRCSLYANLICSAFFLVPALCLAL